MISPTEKASASDLRKDPDHEELVGESYGYFMESIKATSLGTQKKYRKRLAEFLRDHQSNTEDFFKWICEHENPDDPRDVNALKKLLDSYYNLLITREEKPYKFNTVIMFVKAVNHFLRGNMKDIHYKFKPSGLKPEEFNKKVVANGQDRISRDKINYLMSLTANPQYRSVITLLKDTGLRSGDLSQIKYKHIRKALQNPAPEYITFEILPIKNMNTTWLFANPDLGPDAIKYLRLWVEYKKRMFNNRFAYETKSKKKGYFKHLEPKEYPYTEEDDDFVYCYMETKKTHVDKNGVRKPGRGFGDPLEPIGASSMIQILKRKDRSAFKKISAHSFRKSHTTGLTAGDVPERWTNVMQGRRGEGTQGIYQKPDEDELIQAYSEGYYAIALAEPEDAKIEELREQLEEMRQTLKVIVGAQLLKDQSNST